jgi:hypothetical protein
MAIPFLPILKAIAPLLVASSGIAGSLGERSAQSRGVASDERIKKLEDDLFKMSQVLNGTIEQLQATAQELRVQSELNQSRHAKLRLALIFSATALGLSAIALIMVLTA